MSDDWSPGDRCTECGSDLIVEIHADIEFARHSDGSHVYEGGGDRVATLQYECEECREILDRIDIEDLRRVLGVDYDE